MGLVLLLVERFHVHVLAGRPFAGRDVPKPGCGQVQA